MDRVGNVPRHVAEEAVRQAVAAWGTTDDPALGGMVLLDGKLLDMSGGTSTRIRYHAHLAQFVSISLPSHSYAITAILDLGLIRWAPQGRCLTFRRGPNMSQVRTLRKLLDYCPEKDICLDMFKTEWDCWGTVLVGGTDPEQVLSEIVRFYNNSATAQ